MFASHLFNQVDFTKTFDDIQVYENDEHIEVPGSTLKLNNFSAMLFDIKKFDLKTG